MKIRPCIQSVLIILVFTAFAQCTTKPKDTSLTMWYSKPATLWNEALPIGNGRIAAMIYGDPVHERIQLNEGTFWSGGPSKNNNNSAFEALPKVRKLIFDGHYSEADKIINEKFKAIHNHGSMYQTIGNLLLNFNEHENYCDYYRELDIAKALFTSTYRVKNITYKKEVFASLTDNVIVIRLSANKKGKLSFTALLDGPLKNNATTIDGHTLEMTGISSTHEGLEGKVRFNTQAKIMNTGGTLLAAGGKIKVENANEVVILVSVATNFIDYKTLGDNEKAKCEGILLKAEKKPYNQLLNDHTKTYQQYFNRVQIYLGSTNTINYPTDTRIRNFALNDDPALVSLYYQFGRYLLISCSQPTGQPATLQGLWNHETHPAWDSKYTININTEMNYWPAEKCNLTEMHEPLIEMIKDLSITGQETAKNMYGFKGWVAHHNTDIWRISGLVDGAFWGMWPMGGAWLSQHLWEKYLYNGDTTYLASVYPVLKSACLFYNDFLVEHPENKWLVVSPSISPENAPVGRGTSVCAGATMDNQILFDLFTKTIKAAKILKKDHELMHEFQSILNQLPPMQIGQHGQLQEWIEDLDDPNDHHRHVSHLYGLFPSNQITPNTSTELFNAAKTSLLHRGDVSTGWSMGWKVNLWARLFDGNHALKLISDQLTIVDSMNTNGGTYPNLFDAHPPFQIDGNFGCTSGITEMLLQCHDGYIHILPALPDKWAKKGKISGIRTYGGFEISFCWEHGSVKELSIKSTLGGNCRIKVPNKMLMDNGNQPAEAVAINPNHFFETAIIKSPVIKHHANSKNFKINTAYCYDIPTNKDTLLTLKSKNKL